jgi:L-threonylcarbamoyladenylate synthase
LSDGLLLLVILRITTCSLRVNGLHGILTNLVSVTAMLTIAISLPADEEALRSVTSVLASDGVIAYPTDTLYGLGCAPESGKALERIYRIKGREHTKPLLMLLDEPWRLNSWCAEVPTSARRLMHHWPAPLTLVMKVRHDLPPDLLRGGDSLGFRVPDHALCRAICAAAGGTITSTSANRSGRLAFASPEEIESALGFEIDAVVDAGPLPPSLPSTIVLCEGDTTQLLRPGAFSVPELTDSSV